MTNFDSFIKDIQKFQQSPLFSEELITLYKDSLWNTDMSKFLDT